MICISTVSEQDPGTSRNLYPTHDEHASHFINKPTQHFNIHEAHDAIFEQKNRVRSSNSSVLLRHYTVRSFVMLVCVTC